MAPSTLASDATYRSAGIDTAAEEQALSAALVHLDRTLRARAGKRGGAVLPNGFFANVLDLGTGRGIAISTDGVGSKVLIAQQLDKYDTIGIDCIAMNVNDVLCVGAEPLSLVDYLAVEALDPVVMAELAKGLAAGAETANVTIPGGETAQLPDSVCGTRPGSGFDLVGTCIGDVELERIIAGQRMQPGDVILGLRSSGIHSNGLTLARRVLFDQAKLGLGSHADELGRTLGEELLEPTRIYVREVLEMLAAGLRVTGLAHITSDGLLNLPRLHADVAYVVEQLPQPPPIFAMIQRLGGIGDAEMFKTFNMGVGFCVILHADDVQRAREIAKQYGVASMVLGHVEADPRRRVRVLPKNLVGEHKEFAPATS